MTPCIFGTKLSEENACPLFLLSRLLENLIFAQNNEIFGKK